MPDGTVLLRAKTGTLEAAGGMLRGKSGKPVPVSKLGLFTPDEA